MRSAARLVLLLVALMAATQVVEASLFHHHKWFGKKSNFIAVQTPSKSTGKTPATPPAPAPRTPEEPEPEPEEDTDDEEGDCFDTVAAAAQASPELSILVAAASAAGLVDNLANPSFTATLLAPTNDAFAALLENLGITQEDALGNTDLLTTILTYHVIPGTVARAADLSDGQELSALQGETITVGISGSTVTFEPSGQDAPTATVVTADICAGSSVIHVIDAVLLPQEALDALSNGGEEEDTEEEVVTVEEETEEAADTTDEDAIERARLAAAQVQPRTSVEGGDPTDPADPTIIQGPGGTTVG